jgi:hypothetical protein
MKKNKAVVLPLISACMLAAWLLTAGVLPAVADDTAQNETTGKQDVPIKKQTPKKKVIKTPDVFIPTDKVSADRAVAFPTDI